MAVLETNLKGEKPPPRVRIDVSVFVGAAVLVSALALTGVLAPDQLAAWSQTSLDWVLLNFSWLFVFTAVAFVGFAIFLAATKYGSVRLGADDDRPQFRTASWIAMMFSAGMGSDHVFRTRHTPAPAWACFDSVS